MGWTKKHEITTQKLIKPKKAKTKQQQQQKTKGMHNKQDFPLESLSA